jgi:hypothetical protein
MNTENQTPAPEPKKEETTTEEVIVSTPEDPKPTEKTEEPKESAPVTSKNSAHYSNSSILIKK